MISWRDFLQPHQLPKTASGPGITLLSLSLKKLCPKDHHVLDEDVKRMLLPENESFLYIKVIFTLLFMSTKEILKERILQESGSMSLVSQGILVPRGHHVIMSDTYVITGSMVHSPLSIFGAVHPVDPWNQPSGSRRGNQILLDTQIR